MTTPNVASILPELTAAAIRAVEAVMPERADAIFDLRTPADVCRREVARALAALGVDGRDELSVEKGAVVVDAVTKDQRAKCRKHAQFVAHAMKCPDCDGSGWRMVRKGEQVYGLRVELVPGKSVRVFGVASNYARAVAVDRTFELGDVVEVDSYNLVYTERLTRITTSFVAFVRGGRSRESRLDLATFASKNWQRCEVGFENRSELLRHTRDAECHDSHPCEEPTCPACSCPDCRSGGRATGSSPSGDNPCATCGGTAFVRGPRARAEVAAAVAPAANAIAARRLAGRCANGAERDGGRIWHGVSGSSWVAVCGVQPGRRSAGWSSRVGEAITCPRCRKTLGLGLGLGLVREGA